MHRFHFSLLLLNSIWCFYLFHLTFWCIKPSLFFLYALELEVKTSADQGESSSGQPVDDELDGLPVFGTDEDDWEIDSSFAQKALEQMEKNCDDKDESQDGLPTSGADAGEFENNCTKQTVIC